MLCFTVKSCFLLLPPFIFILETHFFFYHNGDATKPENNPHFIQGSQVLLSKPSFSRIGFPSFHGMCPCSPEQKVTFLFFLISSPSSYQGLMLSDTVLLLCVGSKEGHGNQFNAGWPKMCLISLLVYDSLYFHPIYGLRHPANLTWSCSSFISLFLAGFGCLFIPLLLSYSSL